MANKKYEETDVQAIAEAIREKTGSEDTFKVSDMASGVNEVYEMGKKAQYDEFWDSYQQNGERSNYTCAFAGSDWKKGTTFKPKYDIVPTSVVRMFMEHNSTSGSGAYDLAAYLEELGVKLDLSNLTGSTTYMFYDANISRIPELDLRNAQTLESMIRSNRIVTIDKIVLNNEGNQSFAVTFLNCSRLANIKFEGVIGRDISFSASPLTVDSMKSIITHLKDYSTDTTNHYAYAVTFKTSAFEALKAEGATAKYNGVVCTWAELIDNLKWNLVLA